MSEVGLCVLSIGLAVMIWAAYNLSRRVKDLEQRDWPQRVVEWRSVPVYTNCRCVTEEIPRTTVRIDSMTAEDKKENSNG